MNDFFQAVGSIVVFVGVYLCLGLIAGYFMFYRKNTWTKWRD